MFYSVTFINFQFFLSKRQTSKRKKYKKKFASMCFACFQMTDSKTLARAESLGGVSARAHLKLSPAEKKKINIRRARAYAKSSVVGSLQF